MSTLVHGTCRADLVIWSKNHGNTDRRQVDKRLFICTVKNLVPRTQGCPDSFASLPSICSLALSSFID